MAGKGYKYAVGEPELMDSSELKKLINLKKSIYSVNIIQNDGKWTEKGKAFLIQSDLDKSFFLLTVKSVVADHQSSHQIAASRYRSIKSKLKKQKNDYVIKITAPSSEETHTNIISLPVSKLAPKCTCCLKPNHETEGNQESLVAYTLCGSNFKLVELHFKLNGQKYDLCRVIPELTYNKITEEPELFIGSPVLVKGDLDLVVGVVDKVENGLQPLLFNQSINLPPNLRPYGHDILPSVFDGSEAAAPAEQSPSSSTGGVYMMPDQDSLRYGFVPAPYKITAFVYMILVSTFFIPE